MNDVSAGPLPPPPAVPVVVAATPVAFVGIRADFRRLLMRGALLELLTLGFYRFWLTTDMRRHLWSHTSAGGDVLEYVGTAKELLIGFLFALAILMPVYLAYFFIGLEAERWQAFASIPLVLFFYFFAQFAIYRARRYRLTRTIWRGVRFWMTGSGVSYAWRAGLWSLLVIVTLGFALPWYQAALERYKMRYTHYGDLAGRFDGTGGGLFKRAGWIWVVIMLTLIILAMLPSPMPLGAALMRHAGMTDTHLGLIAGLLAFALFIALPFFYPLYRSAEWRWWISGIRFGEVRFESRLRPGALIGLYWKVIGWSMLLLMGLSMWFGAAIGGAVAALGALGKFQPEDIARVFEQPSVLVLVALGYILAALAFGVVMRLYLRRDVWARVAAASLVYNLAAAENVAARGQAAGALGEGFADSLDVGGF
jgi:uncharacterized membrane protein YjgN (DUF898 family)